MWQVSAVLLVGLTAVSGAFKLYYDKAEAQKEAIAVQLRQSADNQALLENSIADLNNQVLQAEQDKEEAFKRITALQEANAEAREEVDNLKSKFDKHNMNVLSLRKPKLIENIINRGTKEVLNELENITNPASSNM
jgi:septation ring formation regulator EzrA|tara:strand:- start:1410 stop:1817 length:408 start_codon:yes stop_codon:yes gene_type:complete